MSDLFHELNHDIWSFRPDTIEQVLGDDIPDATSYLTNWTEGEDLRITSDPDGTDHYLFYLRDHCSSEIDVYEYSFDPDADYLYCLFARTIPCLSF